MAISFSQSFKLQAIEKALSRQNDIQLKDVVESLGIGYSTLQKWIRQSKNQQLDPASDGAMTKEKRPQDWTAEECLNVVIVCGSNEARSSSARQKQACAIMSITPKTLQRWSQAEKR